MLLKWLDFMIDRMSIYMWDLKVEVSVITHSNPYEIIVIDLIAFQLSMSSICCILSLDGSYAMK